MDQADPRCRPLFARFPALIGKLPWMPLADLPSPVQKLEKAGAALGVSDLWMKRDDINSKLYGGNKPRKFEFLFADARAKGATAVMTLGSAGSNHGVATTLFCRHLGFDPWLALVPQPVLTYARRNILVNHALGAKFMFSGNDVFNVANILRFYAGQRLRGAKAPYFMFFGGSAPRGNVGFVDAALELAEQVSRGETPLPRYIFVTTGSCGTHAGLLVGLRLLGLPTEVIGVRIVPKAVTNRAAVALHANLIVRLLRSYDPSFPKMHFRAGEIHLLDNFYGGQYARPTREGKEAIRFLKETEGLPLDPTYTGKSFAGMIDFIRRLPDKNAPILYWQTLNAVDLSPHIPRDVPADLPAPLKRYFTEPLYDPEL